MATIDDIIAWANTLPAWQGDVVRRILATDEQTISDADYAEIMNLAKVEMKLVPSKDLKPIAPIAGQFSGAPATKTSVKLLSIEDVKNVNIIKEGESQPFAETGVTVIYGDNGSGKSGYSRILKLACQARDKEERLHSNVFAAKPAGQSTAILKIKQDQTPKDIQWTYGATADPVLTNITVFDARCARVITDDRNQITYMPYGCDVFEKLAAIVARVKADLAVEIVIPQPIQDSAIAVGSSSSKFLLSLTETVKDDVIQTATSWTPEDEQKLSAQEELARSSNPAQSTQEIARLEKFKGRVSDIANTVARINVAITLLTNDSLQKALGEVNAAQLAHASAIAERKTPEVLSGVASTNQWEILYKAAKQYSEEIAYPGADFPKTDAVCVLCQQLLSEEAKARFARFKKFMEDTTLKVLVAKREALKSLRDKVEAIVSLDATALDSFCDQMAAIDIQAAEDLKAYQAAITAKKATVLALLKEGEDPQKAMALSPWPNSVEAKLRAVVGILTQRITEITNTAKPEEYKKLVANITELKSRKALNARRSDVAVFIGQVRRNAALRRASDALSTYEITRQGTALIKKNLTPDLINAFKAELSSMGAKRIPISLKPSGSAGETAHEILLEGAVGRAKTSEILSEGEARVIAIAGFLAELALVPHTNAIVLDDPVSSLDHVFIGKIAARLAREGLKRQVIVFTHNIAFLMELEDASLELARAGSPVNVTTHTLRRDGQEAGITTNGVPWYAMKVKERAHHLETVLHSIKSLYPARMPEYNKEAAQIYGLLREAWESCVEDDLLYSVVCRYRNSVQTLKLMEVGIDDGDIHHIDLHMTKASTWMTGHDKSKALHHDRPEPDELSADIVALREFSKKINARRKQTRERREKLLQPTPSREGGQPPKRDRLN